MQISSHLNFVISRIIEQKKHARSVTLAVGELIPVTDQEITSEWSRLIDGTTLGQTILRIHRVQAELQCMACFEKYHPKDQVTLCPVCGGVGAKVLSGEEYKVEAIDE